MNKMREITVEKVTLNIGAGEAGAKLEKAKTIVQKITGKKISVTIAKKRTTFPNAPGKGRPIGAKVTLRNKDALDFLKNAFKAVGNKLKSRQFDSQGNFAFGVEEYINLPGIKYDPEIGMLGMDVCVTVKRPGYSIKNRRINPKKIGKKHIITKEESIEFAKKQFGVVIE